MSTRVLQWPRGARWTMDVQLDGRVYTISAAWNTRMETWALTLDTADGVRLLDGVRVVLNKALLPRWRTEKMPPGEFFVVCPTDRCRHDPGRESIGAEDAPMRLVYREAEDATV